MRWWRSLRYQRHGPQMLGKTGQRGIIEYIRRDQTTSQMPVQNSDELGRYDRIDAVVRKWTIRGKLAGSQAKQAREVFR